VASRGVPKKGKNIKEWPGDSCVVHVKGRNQIIGRVRKDGGEAQAHAKEIAVQERGDVFLVKKGLYSGHVVLSLGELWGKKEYP